MRESTYTSRAVAALTEAARTEHDFGGWLAHVLATVAGQLGSSDAPDDKYLPKAAGRGKLTDAQARAIRDRVIFGEGTQDEIAAEFGVCRSTIRSIAAGRTWGWLA